MEKFESERNTRSLLDSVILGFIPRIHAKHNLNRHPRAWLLARPEDLDSRVTPENDNQWNFTKGLDVVRECAGIFKRRVQKEYTSAKISSRHQLNEFSLGRSMIEMLGVLAIIGVLSVGGIAGYSKAMMQFKINQTKQEISEIITNIRTLYAQQKDFNGINDLPLELIADKTHLDQYGRIEHPFNDIIGIENGSDYGVANSYSSYETFNIRVRYIPKEACIALATSDWGSISSTGVAGIAIGDISARDALDADITRNCNSQRVTTHFTDGYYACSGQKISPAIAAQYCKDNRVYNNFTLKIVK